MTLCLCSVPQLSWSLSSPCSIADEVICYLPDFPTVKLPFFSLISFIWKILWNSVNIFPSSYFLSSIHRLFLDWNDDYISYFLINLLLGILALRKINLAYYITFFFFLIFYLYELHAYPFDSWVINPVHHWFFFQFFFQLVWKSVC